MADCWTDTMRLPDTVRQAVRADTRRIAIVGARGWIGRTLVELIGEALSEAAADRIVCFGSHAAEIALNSGMRLRQAPLEALGALDHRPSLLFHLAFLTKDKAPDMSADAYRRANQLISDSVAAALDPIGVDRLFVASSGAAAFADDPAAAPDLRLYGALKRDDEHRFAAWATRAPETRRAAICRLYSVSGPFINKPDRYALADLILRALSGGPVGATAPREMWRSYVAVKEVLALALAMLLTHRGEAAPRFDSGGEEIELGALAALVGAELGAPVVPRPIADPAANHYCGDHRAWRALLDRHGLAHLGLAEQIRETAAYLASLEGQAANV